MNYMCHARLFAKTYTMKNSYGKHNSPVKIMVKITCSYGYARLQLYLAIDCTE